MARSGPTKTASCKLCGKTFDKPHRIGQRSRSYCPGTCDKLRHTMSLRTCAVASCVKPAPYGRTMCEPHRTISRLERMDPLRRRVIRRQWDKRRLQRLARRDGNRCHLCKRLVRWDVKHTEATYPSRDHLIPRSAGGGDELVNLALAHRGCNSRRRDRGAAQLRLLG